FSFNACIIPFLLAFVAVMLALEKDEDGLSGRMWQCAAFAALLNSTIFAFAVDTNAYNFKQAVEYCYTKGVSFRGSGAVGAVLGWPIERLFGDTGARILLIVLSVVFLMLMTGTTISSIIRMVRKPAAKTRESLEAAVISTTARQTEKPERRKDIDVDMGEGYVRRRKAKEEVIEEPKDEVDEEVLDATEKFNELQEANDALNVEPEEEDDTVEMLSAEEAEKELKEELKSAKDEPVQEAIYHYPPLTLLDRGAAGEDARIQDGDRMATGKLLVNTLKDFGISTELGDVTCGPSVTRYELVPSAGVKISRITGLSDDIALRLATTGVRIEAPIPNKAAVGIEVPNKARRTVRLRSLLDTNEYRSAKGKLTVALGQDIEGRIVMADLAKMPHLLIAGTTGSGKSVCTNSMIQSVLFRARPDEVKMILIDPKKVEFGVYNGIPHLLIPVVTDPRKAAAALGWAVNEMLKRYQMFADAKARDIGDYNELARKNGEFPPLPLIMIVIDELADLMMAAGNEVEDSICRLTQMARAAGMHMVIATQRPSVDVITGLIKGNIPSRLALTVASGVDSRTILDSVGAEKLLGNGDMLFMPVGQSKPLRVQGCYVSNQEVERVIEFLKNGGQEQEYDQQIIEEIEKQAASSGKSAGRDDDDVGDETDEALPQAIEIAVEAGSISTSMLQRKLRFGYARAGRIIDQMEQRGIIGPSEGSKPRKVLITRQQWIEMNMNNETE
ncbi:MAG: DNA translocase FtsK 4TM domain-containing protein, partial [Clostridia bacterium]|nr:DNA translocase FtsK 4TM domain-containing protein [Clostridia bacterium]